MNKLTFAAVALFIAANWNDVWAWDIEASVGQAQWTKSNATDWWQRGPASEGFSDDFDLKSNTYTLGATGHAVPWLRWRAGYANLGKVNSVANATNFDEEYDFARERCKPGCNIVAYVGHGSVDGLYATVLPEWRHGDWAVYAEAGAWVYNAQFDMAKYGSNLGPYATPYHVPTRNCIGVGPVFGGGVSYKNTSLSVLQYRVDLQCGSEYPAIYQGYTTVVALVQRF